MTQEELDVLTTGVELDEDVKKLGFKQDKEGFESEAGVQDSEVLQGDYKDDNKMLWPPPPPNREHKVVHQLDDVTKDSEKKATELLEKLENISNFLTDSESLANEFNQILDKNIEVFTKLSEKFPHVKTFTELLELNQSARGRAKDIVEHLQNGQDEVMVAMDAMQYQDIHRQKIERVINVMRALSRYMSSLFESRIDDKKRVSSAIYIEGDSNTEVMSNDDIEALIANLGQK